MNDKWFEYINEDDEDFQYLNDISILGDNLINNLSKKTANKTNNNEISLDQVTIDMYDKIEIDDECAKKIEELKRISLSINEKVNDKKINIDFSKFKIKYEILLNYSQLIATTTINGPILVIAGAGSGKTRIITYRVSFMLENNIDPESILLLTFTRKAANEMIDRVIEILKNNSVKEIMAGTFHSFSNYVLRKYSSVLKINPNFTIIDNPDSEDIIGLLKSEMNLEKRDKLFPNKARIFDIISKTKNLKCSVEHVLNKYYKAIIHYKKEIELLYMYYEKYKQAQNVYDYDDLMDKLCYFLKNNIEFREMIQNKYKYIMVDEFQDTNIVQKEIIDLISEKYRNIMVVGDDSQSIYAFRGANYENILRFPDKYKDCKVVKLEENYRSNQGILNFINSINYNAKIGFYKNLFSNNKRMWLPNVLNFYSQEDEAKFIVDKIINLRDNNIELNQVSVLYRASYHSNYIEAELLKRGIPYVKYGGIKFAERKHIKDVIAYLRILLNPLDAVCWNRILKLIPGIGNVKAGQIVQYINRKNGIVDFKDINIDSINDELLKLQVIINDLNQSNFDIKNKINIVKEYYTPILKSENNDWKERLLDIDVLIKISEKYKELEKFLSDFALDPPTNKYKTSLMPLVDETEDKPLILSTIHSAKGLEWYCVFICHLLDGLFPTVKNIKNIEELEEERRLFYVACSRAKEELYLTYPSYVSTYNGFMTLPSRFIAEIEKKQYKY